MQDGRRARLALALFLICISLSALSDYQAGQRAYDAGRYEEAYKLWQDAARHGDVDSLYQLGKLYGEGLGILRSLVRAHAYFNVAAARGHKQALAARQIVESRITAEQLAQAEKLAVELHSDLTASNAQPARSVAQPTVVQAAGKPTWEKGYEWNVHMELPDGRGMENYWIFGGEVTYEGERLLVLNAKGGKFHLTQDLNERALIRGNRPTIVFDPERHVFDWPLQVGKEWEKPYRVVVGDEVGHRPGRFKVEAFAEVKTEAGTFMAFKIIEYGPRGGIRAEEWYAPEVMWKVKAINRSRKKGEIRVHLTSYDLGK